MEGDGVARAATNNESGVGEGTSSQYPFPPKALVEIHSHSAPPPEPSSNSFSCFGTIWSKTTTLPSLEESNRVQLYDSTQPRSQQLKLLNLQLSQVFAAVVDALRLGKPHETVKQHVELIENILINMHHLINTFRIDMARLEVAKLLEDQCRERLELVKKLEAQIEHVELLKQQRFTSGIIMDLSKPVDLIATEDGNNTGHYRNTAENSKNTENPNDFSMETAQHEFARYLSEPIGP